MKYVVVLFIFISASASAQRMKLLSGDLKTLKGQKSYGILFRYDSMHIGDTTTERVYLARKRKSWEEKDPGQGDNFVTIWFSDRKDLYQPAFIENFEKYSHMKLGDPTAHYTLILKTKRTEGGWVTGIIDSTAEIDGELWVVETANKSHVIAKVGFYRFNGNNHSGGDFQMTVRIQSAYVLAGHGLGDFMKRKTH